MESLPGIPVHDPEANLQCRDMCKALWALSKAPEMAYMLRSFKAETSFLARLRMHTEDVPIVKTDKGYALAPDVIDSWRALESVLVAFSDTLLSVAYASPEAKFPFDAFWPLPKDFGYRQVHAVRASAHAAAMRARNACALLLARCTMAVALCTVPGEEPPRWIPALHQASVSPAWVDKLRDSIIADLSPGLRAGAFIDPYGGTAWVNHVPCMIRANLPVYIAWRTSERTDAVL